MKDNTDLLLLDAVGAVACLGLLILGLLHIAKPDADRPRTFGLRLIGIGLLCLAPLLTTAVFTDRMPLDF